MARAGNAHDGRRGLKEDVEALRVSILAAGRVLTHADPTLRHLALAALDQARIAETEFARWRAAAAVLYAALEARGHLEGQVPEGSAPLARADGPWATPADLRVMRARLRVNAEAVTFAGPSCLRARLRTQYIQGRGPCDRSRPARQARELPQAARRAEPQDAPQHHDGDGAVGCGMCSLARGDAEASLDCNDVAHTGRDDAGGWKMKHLRGLMAAGLGIGAERAIRT